MPSGGASVNVTFKPAGSDGTSGSGSSGSSVGSGNTFVDVPAWCADAIDWAVEHGITNGTDASHFDPAGPCTRAQMVTFLWRYVGQPEPESMAMPFTDVVRGSYYEKAVAWAVENGITNGVTATEFAPNATVTRAQTVAFLYRFAKAQSEAKTTFTDVPVNAWFAPAVSWAVDKGITLGTTETTFSPQDPCVRSQIVTFLYRYERAK